MANKEKDNYLGYFLVVGFLVLIAVGGIVASYKSNTAAGEETKYASDASEKPQLKISLTEFDFGRINLNDEQIKEVEIENIGSKDLELGHFSTSCDCTFAKLKTARDESPEFSMHGDSHWTGKIAAGEKATLMVIYRPWKMPVKGKVERVVFFSTNDPGYPQVNVKFSAEVL